MTYRHAPRTEPLDLLSIGPQSCGDVLAAVAGVEVEPGQYDYAQVGEPIEPLPLHASSITRPLSPPLALSETAGG